MVRKSDGERIAVLETEVKNLYKWLIVLAGGGGAYASSDILGLIAKVLK